MGERGGRCFLKTAWICFKQTKHYLLYFLGTVLFVPFSQVYNVSINQHIALDWKRGSKPQICCSRYKAAKDPVDQ